MRLEITRKTDLAIHALIALDAAATRVKGSDLAETIGTTKPFVPQIMTPLIQRGWVGSEPGPTGGYELKADLAEVSLLGVIEAVEGPTANGRCVLRGTPCPPVDICELHVPWNRARDALLRELSATPISDLERQRRGVVS